MSDDFFGKFAKVLSGEEDEAAGPVFQETSVASTPSSPISPHGMPDWVKCAMANAIVSTIAVILTVTLIAG